MKFVGKCPGNFVDHISMPNFHLSSLDDNTTPLKKILKFVYLTKINKVKTK